MTKLSIDSFISKANLIHNFKYDYSLVNFNNNKEKISIICKTHGVFMQRVSAHLEGRGCPDCGRAKSNDSQRITNSDFIKFLERKFGKAYDYSKVIYKNKRSKINIICPHHGEVTVSYDFLKGNDVPCILCKKPNKDFDYPLTSVDNFIRNARLIFPDYDYNKVCNYHKNDLNEFTCIKHNQTFIKSCGSILRGHGCPECERLKKQQTFIQKAKAIHNNRYTYCSTVYKNSDTKVCITCPKHGDFLQKPVDHLQGYGCIYCHNYKGEKDIIEFLKRHNIEFQYQKRFSDLKDIGYLSYDFYIPPKQTLIEYNGIQHYKPIDFFGGKEAYDLQIKHDIIKRDYAKAHNLNLICISYKDNIQKVLSDYLEKGFYDNQVFDQE